MGTVSVASEPVLLLEPHFAQLVTALLIVERSAHNILRASWIVKITKAFGVSPQKTSRLNVMRVNVLLNGVSEP